MKTAETRSTSTTVSRESFFSRGSEQSFFTNQSGGSDFFSKATDGVEAVQPRLQKEVTTESTQPAIQAKLNNSSQTSRLSSGKDASLNNHLIPIQAKCSTCEEEEKLSRKEDADGEELDVQAKGGIEEDEMPIQQKCDQCEEEEKQKQGEGKEEEKVQTQKDAEGLKEKEKEEEQVQKKEDSIEEEEKVQNKEEKTGADLLQAKCSECDKEEAVQGKELINNEPAIVLQPETSLQLKCKECEEEEKEQVENGVENKVQNKVETEVETEVERKSERPIIQEKLTIGKVGDKYERQADAVADQTVQRIQTNAGSNPLADGKAEEEKEDKIMTEPMPDYLQMSMADTPPSSPPASNNGDEQPNDSHLSSIQRRCRECEEGDVIFRKAINSIQRAGAGDIKANGSRESIVALAKSQIGKVEAKTNDGSGKRKGADRLLEYFQVAAPGVWPDSIIETAGAKMPSWCGIFSVWAHKKAGKDIGVWQMGKGVSAFGTLTPTTDPQPGDIGYMDKMNQHHCIIVKIEGNTVHSIDGNSGLFSEVKENTRARADYTGFFTAFGSGGSTVQKKGNEKAKESSASSDLEGRLSSSKGSGNTLPDPVRSQMESAMGADFSGVKIHTGSDAVSMSKDLHAQAFTHGSDIYFNAGKYDTQSSSGQHLLSHELTHTVQQGAAVQRKGVPDIQRNGGSTSDEDAAKAVYDALDGYTSSDDSFIVWNNFDSKSKTSTDAIVKSVASKANLSIQGTYEWMHSDMVTSDWKKLLAHFINVEAYFVEKAIAVQVADYLSGYTSDANSKEIYSIFVGVKPIGGELLSRVLTQLEAETNNARNPMAEYLFGDLTLIDAHRLSTQFFNSGSTYGVEYASYWVAYKVKELIAGYTSTADSDAIVKNFKRVPVELLSHVLYELEKLTMKEWDESASKALMDDMQQEDYDKLRAMMPQLPAYNPQKSFLESAWDKISPVFDFLTGMIEYSVCGLFGIVLGALSVVSDIIIMVVDLVFAIIHFIGMIIYYLSGESICRESKEKVFEFFSGIGQFFDAPIDAMGKMWDEMVLEASLIEGPLQDCQQAIFWCKKIGNLLVNIILILAAGYGAIKIVLEGVEGLVALIRAGELLNAIKGIPGKLLVKVKGLPSAVAKSTTASVARVIELFKNPVKVISTARNTVTTLRLAAQDEKFFQFLRQQAGKIVEKEGTYWKERKEFWKKGADEVDGHIVNAEGKLTSAAENVVDDPAKSEALVKESEASAQVAEKKANELMDEVKGTKEGEPKGPSLNISAEAEAWEKTLSEETLSWLKSNPEARRFWHEMDPSVRKALTYCNTPCIPLNIDPATVVEIQQFMQRMKITDHNGLREYLHMYRSNPKELSDAVKVLKTVKNLQELEIMLDNKLIATIQKTHGVTIRRGTDGLWEFPTNGTVIKEFEIGTHASLTGTRGTDSFFQSHHGIQNAWAKNRFSGLNVYDENKAKAILLRSRNFEGGSRGTPHGLINDLQGARKGDIATRTFKEELKALSTDLDILGVPPNIKAAYIKEVEQYFGEIYTTLKKTMNDTALKGIFGDWVP